MKPIRRLIGLMILSLCTVFMMIFPPAKQAFSAAPVTPLTPLNQPYDVAQQATYTVSSTDKTDTFYHHIEAKTYPTPPGGLMSDGPKWNGFLRQLNRTVVVNLGQPYTLTSASIDFLEETTRGILFPTHVQFLISQNGTQWFTVNDVKSNTPLYYSGTLTQTFSTPIPHITAQYVKLVFPVDVWVLAKNLQVYGSPLLTPSLAQLPIAPPKPFAPGTLSPSSKIADGISNALLVYSGANGQEGTWTPSDFDPMVAYHSGNNQISGKMFDTFLFLPYGSSLTTIYGWENYMNSLFTPNQQLDALNQTVGADESGLASIGVNEPTVNVILAIPYPNASITNFGKLWSSSSLSFSSNGQGTYVAYQNRLRAIEFYINSVLARFREAHYAHLRLVGLYWDAESVSYASPNEVNLIEQAANLTHKNKLNFFWIPTYNASGLVSGSSYGFDDIILQSNYYETPSLTPQRMVTAANEAFQLNLGLELEMGNGILTSQTARDRYYNELVAAFNSNAEGNTVHAVYAGSKLLVQAAQSTDPAVRNVYVETYDFLIGQFTNSTYING